MSGEGFMKSYQEIKGEPMKDHNQIYIETVTVDEIPWHRLATVYKRASDFPGHFDTLWEMKNLEEIQKALKEIAINIEHQSTLWQATPFALIFLLRIFKNVLEKRNQNQIADYISESLLELFAIIAEGLKEGKELEHPNELPSFSDMLKEEFLWSEEYDEEEDIRRYEEGEVFPDTLFYSFYHYSYSVLSLCKPLLHPLQNEKEKILYSFISGESTSSVHK